MPRSAQKVPVSLKWYSNCVTRTSPPVLSVCPPPEYQSGTQGPERKAISLAECESCCHLGSKNTGEDVGCLLYPATDSFYTPNKTGR